MSPRLLTILHLSDFHFTKRVFREQEIVVEALSKDLEELCVGHRKPDLIIFTGDLVNAAGKDSYDESFDLFIDRLSKATGCSEERIYMTPGNHDASQKIVELYSQQHTKWRTHSEDMDYVNKLYQSEDFGSKIRDKFKDFYDLEKYVSNNNASYQNSFVSVFNIDALNVDLFAINTAVFTGAGLDCHGVDDKKLAISEYAMRDALKHKRDSTITIFLFHHPISSLAQSSELYLSSITQKYANIVLFGHMHNPSPQSSVGIEGKVFSNQAGAIFAGRQSHIGYSLICVAPGEDHFEATLRTYFKERDCFDDAVDIINDGKFYSSQESRQFWRDIGAPVDEAKLRQYLTGDCLGELRSESEELLDGERSIYDVFVSPPIKKVSFHKAVDDDEEGSTIDQDIDFEEIISGSSNVIVYAFSEHGKTSFLRGLQHRLLSDAQKIKTPRLPLLVDFEDIKFNLSRLEGILRSKGKSSEFDVLALLRLGNACLLIDDVVFSDDKGMSILRAFVSKYPRVRYIFTTEKNSWSLISAHAVPGMPVHFEYCEVSEFRRREMRQLVLHYSKNTNVNEVLDTIQSEIAHINLPFTAANGSIFLLIYQEHSGFRPINRSVLIEQFVDIILRKGAIDQSRRETFDYANKTALLSHIAGWMAKNDCYTVKSDAVQEVMRDYVHNFGLIVSVSDLFDEFMSIRLFVKRPSGEIAFRYRAVLEYFLSLEMANNPNFKGWLLEEERYLSYISEIQYYAGKNRNDYDLINLIEARYNSIIEEVEAEAGSIDLHKIAHLTLPNDKKNSDNEVEYFSEQLSENPLSEEERDQILDGEIPRDPENRQEVFRPQADDITKKLILSVMLYSGIMKNMELIKDADKRRHLNNIWGGWGRLLHLSLQVAEQIAKYRKFLVNGVLYEVSAPRYMSDKELTRQIALNLPSAVSRMISSNLGSEKLEKQLNEPIHAESEEPLIFNFFRAALLGDLRLPSTQKAIEGTLLKLRSSKYLVQAFVWKIIELRRLDKLPEAKYKSLIPKIAEAISGMKGGALQSRKNEKSRQIGRLQQRDLLLRMKKSRKQE